MNPLDVAVSAGALLIVLAIIGSERIRDVLDDLCAGPDRRRHLSDCRIREQMDRLRSGDALADAMQLQLREIRALPSVEPRRFA